jgi:hypothetical protein
MRKLRMVLAGALAVAAIAPGIATAKTYRTTFQMPQLTPTRVWSETSGLPFLFKFGPTYRYRFGANTWVGTWAGASVGRKSATAALNEVWKNANQYALFNDGVIVDRKLTAVEAQRFKIAADLYRDADVLVVATGHPACAGLTRAQARGIATGAITRWSQVVAGPAIDAIKVRYLTDGSGAGVPHLGTRWVGSLNKQRVNYAPGGLGAFDGGVGLVASGDQAVAAITTWSRVRFRAAGVCVVPLDGIAPDDATVASLQYPEAFPVAFVLTRKVPGRSALARAGNAVERRAMTVMLNSAKAKTVLRQRGLLVVGDPPPGA